MIYSNSRKRKKEKRKKTVTMNARNDITRFYKHGPTNIYFSYSTLLISLELTILVDIRKTTMNQEIS